jgi:Tol biopolymer transport system component
MRTLLKMSVVLLVVCAGALCAATSPVVAAENGRIGFATDREGQREIYAVNPDGTGLGNLTKNPSADDMPSASRERMRYAFASDRGGNFDIYTVDSTGGTSIDISANPASDTQPAFGATDFALAWVSDRDGNNEIYTGGVGVANNRTNNPASDATPAWSPNSGSIAFTSDRDGNNEIYVMASDGTGVTRLTNDPATDSAPSWSPDGQKIVFESNRDGNFEVYAMNVDGSAQTNLTNNAGSDRQPEWSPDGTRIVFQTNRDGNFEVYAMNPDGTGSTRLTSSPGADVNPSWAIVDHNIGYPRPRGATPLRASLVPAYQECTAPNRTHGGPLAFPSCVPPTQTSGFLTIGSPDANGAQSRSLASVLLKVKNTSPEDVLISTQVTDVRCLPATSPSVCTTANALDGPDYSGQLKMVLTIRLTDRNNGPSLSDPETMVDIPFAVDVSCSNTPSLTQEGGDCSIGTTANAITPGMVPDNKRSIWQLDKVDVYDTGADGSAATTGDNTLFLTQGVFVP